MDKVAYTLSTDPLEADFVEHNGGSSIGHFAY